MWENEEERIIIQDFMRHSYDNYKEGKRDYKFYFANGDIIIARYDAEGDSDNGLEMDDPDYEEFYEFYFEILKIEKKMKDSTLDTRWGLCLNYHNFPIKWELYEGETEDTKGE